MPLKIVRGFLMLFGAVSGYFLGSVGYRQLIEPLNLNFLPSLSFMPIIAGLIFSLLFMLIGFAIAQPLINAFVHGTRFLEARLSDVPLRGLVSGTLGLMAGLVVSLLIIPAVKTLPLIGAYMPLFIMLVLGYLGASMGYRWRDALVALPDTLLAHMNKRPDRKPRKEAPKGTGDLASDFLPGTRPKVLDTSVIIDGRIVDIARSGFLEGPLIITPYVLDELRHIADSADALKRNRGRRGLDVLNDLRECGVQVVTLNKDYPDIVEVDAKLVMLAKDLQGCVVTNDYNLNKVASFQNVEVLNVNELAGAIKTVVLPGEAMRVEVVGRGKGAHQGVGYLEDGTMIVVEGGRDRVGESLDVVVTSVIQTNAGRMIFVRLED
ncbi:PIN/TRAM domain-containing protein [Peptococcus simiae]|uniref:PIN/TRAM domain-containing protein n=1 Tax=Peptococcus simiae TaxID=1643805 RepID=UPI00397E9749